MATQKPVPAPIARYVTVQDAVERIGVAERTLRRWIEETDDHKKKFRHIMRDASGFVRLDLEEVEQIAQSRGEVVPSLHHQIELLRERIEVLESEYVFQVQQYQELRTRVEHIQQFMTTQMQVLAHILPSEDGQKSEPSLALAELLTHLTHLTQRHSKKVNAPEERRDFPPGTLRLVDFAQSHASSLSELKKLYMGHEIDLAVYQRESPALRNKQEWWITPMQHHALADYCERHQLPYTPCPQCMPPMQQEQQEEEAKEE